VVGGALPAGDGLQLGAQANGGKKSAPAHTFAVDNADVFVTVDSGTSLERRAIEEGLQALAKARLLGPELTALLTYDDRLAKAAADAGIPVLAPHGT
jgi:hypothetical protein